MRTTSALPRVQRNNWFASRCVALAVLSGIIACAWVGGAAADENTAADFYAGKVLTVIVPYGAAGGYEYWAAALKPYLEKSLGVSRIDIVNKTGGGGIVGANYLYHAKPDGLTIGEVNGIGSIFEQIVDKPGVNFDMTKFGWIGSPNIETTVTVARSGSPFKSFENLWRLRDGKKKVTALSAGYGGSNYVGTAVPLSSFHIPYRMLLAYQGSSAVKAGLLRGDGDIATQAYSVFRPLLESHSVVPLYISDLKRFSQLPRVPTIVELARRHRLSHKTIETLDVFARVIGMGKDWAGPPGVAPERLAFLRAAFRKATQNRAFVKATEKADRFARYTSAQEIERTIADVIAHKAKFVPFLEH